MGQEQASRVNFRGKPRRILKTLSNSTQEIIKTQLEVTKNNSRCKYCGRILYKKVSEKYIVCSSKCKSLIKKIDYIKIDTEGNDLKVLIGAFKTIKKHKP